MSSDKTTVSYERTENGGFVVTAPNKRTRKQVAPVSAAAIRLLEAMLEAEQADAEIKLTLENGQVISMRSRISVK